METKTWFDLACDLYQGFSPARACTDYLERLLPKGSQFLILDRNKVLYPECFSLLRPEEIWEIIMNDRAAVFCTRIPGMKPESGADCLLCAGFLGEDKSGRDIAVAVACSEEWKGGREFEETFSGIVARLKRFYTDFCHSRAAEAFIENDSQFRYVVDLNTMTIVARKTPPPALADDALIALEELLFEDLVRRLLTEDYDRGTLDARVKNIDITHFNLAGMKYALLSMELNRPPVGQTDNYDQIVRNFVQMTKNRLSALQTALGQLELQKGQILGEADVPLMQIIRDSADDINRLVDDLHHFGPDTETVETSPHPGEAIKTLADPEPRRREGALT